MRCVPPVVRTNQTAIVVRSAMRAVVFYAVALGAARAGRADSGEHAHAVMAMERPAAMEEPAATPRDWSPSSETPGRLGTRLPDAFERLWLAEKAALKATIGGTRAIAKRLRDDVRLRGVAGPSTAPVRAPSR